MKPGGLIQHRFICPHCGRWASMLIDLAAGSGSCIEDCEVCCGAVGVSFEVEEGMLASFEARPES